MMKIAAIAVAAIAWVAWVNGPYASHVTDFPWWVHVFTVSPGVLALWAFDRSLR